MEQYLAMKKLLLTLAFLLLAPSAWAQCTGVFPANTVCGNLTGGAAPPKPFSSSGQGVTQVQVTGTYTPQNTDCWQLISAAGGSFYSVNLGVATTYPSGCKITIANSDPMPTGANSTGAKFVTANGIVGCYTGASPGTYVWPLQSIEVTRIGNGWQVTRCPGMWPMPAGGVFTINVNPVSGSDTFGVADGLATGARAFQSVNNAFGYVTEMMQSSYLSQTQLTIKMCAGCTDTQDVHIPSHGGAPVGSQGGDGTIIDCNGGTLSGSVNLFFYSIVAFNSCNFTNGLGATQGAVIALAGHTNTITGGPGIGLSQASAIRCLGCVLNITGTFSSVFNLETGSSITSVVINQTGNVTYSDVAFRVQSGSFAGIQSWTTNAHTATGKKFAIIECSSMEGTAFIAGTVAGSVSGCGEAN